MTEVYKLAFQFGFYKILSTRSFFCNYCDWFLYEKCFFNNINLQIHSGTNLVRHVKMDTLPQESQGSLLVAVPRGDVNQSGAVFGSVKDGGLELLGQQFDNLRVALLGCQMERRSICDWKKKSSERRILNASPNTRINEISLPHTRKKIYIS